jgi:CRISPR-associated protein (TIGR03984 family)
MSERPYIHKIDTPPANDADVPAWLAGQATKERPFLLAFADDGIIWGLWRTGSLVTSIEAAQAAAKADPDNPKLRQSTAVSPPLRGVTLQSASLFGPADEMRLFRDENGDWQACRIGDPSDPKDVIRESQLLVGSEVVTSLEEFTHVRDRVQQGLDHIPPVKLLARDVADGQGPRLVVHHHIEYDGETGEARIAGSRLVFLSVGPRDDDKPTDQERNVMARPVDLAGGSQPIQED